MTERFRVASLPDNNPSSVEQRYLDVFDAQIAVHIIDFDSLFYVSMENGVPCTTKEAIYEVSKDYSDPDPLWHMSREPNSCTDVTRGHAL